ncbi:MAG: hypothetical protein ACI8RZ_007749, partial [Myxococcota bacterium]
YRSRGGLSCIDCHMPTSDTPAVDGDVAPLLSVDGPTREGLRSHTFIGADYPLDADFEDTHRPEREALMQAAVALSIDDLEQTRDGVEFEAVIRNVLSGHNLPSGFAFARQLWIEVVVTDQAGREVFTSGVLADESTDDLCDADTISDDLGRFVKGCGSPTRADPHLVNLQGILLDDVEGTDQRDGLGNVVLARAPGAKEVSVQHVTSGPIARKRGGIGETLTPIPPGGEGRYRYIIPSSVLSGVTTANISLRLRFRNLPPYFLRGLNDLRQPEDGPDLEPLISNLQVVDMAEAKGTVDVRTSQRYR